MTHYRRVHTGIGVREEGESNPRRCSVAPRDVGPRNRHQPTGLPPMSLQRCAPRPAGETPPGRLAQPDGATAGQASGFHRHHLAFNRHGVGLPPPESGPTPGSGGSFSYYVTPRGNTSCLLTFGSYPASPAIRVYSQATVSDSQPPSPSLPLPCRALRRRASRGEPVQPP